MSRNLLFVLAAIPMLGADSPWDKVRELKSGTELRIYKKGGRPPVIATLDEATDDRLSLVVRNEQVFIPKEDIDRIDCRPKQIGTRFTRQSKTTSTDATQQSGVGPVPQGTPAGPTTSTNSSFGMGSRPDFETIYRRRSTPPQSK